VFFINFVEKTPLLNKSRLEPIVGQSDLNMDEYIGT